MCSTPFARCVMPSTYRVNVWVTSRMSSLLVIHITEIGRPCLAASKFTKEYTVPLILYQM